jgi:hypothetical protein
MSMLEEFPTEKEIDLENTFIRIDDTKEKITYKLSLLNLVRVIKKEISKK